MTEAEALAIAMKAIVSAFVGTPAPAPAPPPPPARPLRRKPRRPKPGKAPEIAFTDLPPMPRFDVPLSPEPEPDIDAPPPVTVAELEAMMNGTAPEGTYVREQREEVGGGWPGPS